MSSAEIRDDELIKRIIRGDQPAADIFVDHYKRLIYSILKRDYRLPDDVADDVFQDFFERLCKDNYRALRKWRGKGMLSSYLAVVAHNLVRDYLRSQRKRTSKDLPGGSSDLQDPGDYGVDPEHSTHLEEIRRSVHGALDKLEARDRELLRLKYYRDWSYKQIAAEMRLTVDQVGVYLSRAEARLRKILCEKFPDLFPNDEKDM